MILVRDVFYVKPGKAQAIIEANNTFLSAFAAHLGKPAISYMLLSIDGRMDTVVLETEQESHAAFEDFLRDAQALPEFPAWVEQLNSLTKSWRREYYSIVGS
jgi:hypothetical protein